MFWSCASYVSCVKDGSFTMIFACSSNTKKSMGFLWSLLKSNRHKSSPGGVRIVREIREGVNVVVSREPRHPGGSPDQPANRLGSPSWDRIRTCWRRVSRATGRVRHSRTFWGADGGYRVRQPRVTRSQFFSKNSGDLPRTEGMEGDLGGKL